MIDSDWPAHNYVFLHGLNIDVLAERQWKWANVSGSMSPGGANRSDVKVKLVNILLIFPSPNQVMWQPTFVCLSVRNITLQFSGNINNDPRNSWLNFGLVLDSWRHFDVAKSEGQQEELTGRTSSQLWRQRHRGSSLCFSLGMLPEEAPKPPPSSPGSSKSILTSCPLHWLICRLGWMLRSLDRWKLQIAFWRPWLVLCWGWWAGCRLLISCRSLSGALVWEVCVSITCNLWHNDVCFCHGETGIYLSSFQLFRLPTTLTHGNNGVWKLAADGIVIWGSIHQAGGLPFAMAFARSSPRFCAHWGKNTAGCFAPQSHSTQFVGQFSSVMTENSVASASTLQQKYGTFNCQLFC